LQRVKYSEKRHTLIAHLKEERGRDKKRRTGKLGAKLASIVEK